MQLFLAPGDAEAELELELAEAFPGAPLRRPHPLLVEMDFPRPDARLPYLVFARQWLPDARAAKAESINAWARVLFEAVAGELPENQPWSLHVEPHYVARAIRRVGARAWHSAKQRGHPEPSPKEPEAPGQGGVREAGRQRCGLIRSALLELLHRKRRHLLRCLRVDPAPFTPETSLVQLLLVAPEEGFISVAKAPIPALQRHVICPYPKGQVATAADPAAPSRAFAKLIEAELRLGHSIQRGETCVDLGAAPGSWTYVAVNRGATVTAVDRSPLRGDLMANPRVRFTPGDAFRFRPPQPVDWLLCDVIAPPEKTVELLVEWLRRKWCRRFIVTVKLKEEASAPAVERLRGELPSLAGELLLTHLCANKKEVCAFGTAQWTGPGTARPAA